MRASAARKRRSAVVVDPAAGLTRTPASGMVAVTAPPIEAEADGLAVVLAELATALSAARGRVDEDPYANPITLLALGIVQRLTHGALDEPTTEALIQRLTREAFQARAATARQYLGELDPARNT
jgi:phosphoenolpyruvate carboxylase